MMDDVMMYEIDSIRRFSFSVTMFQFGKCIRNKMREVIYM
jgi:hypothetical protein